MSSLTISLTTDELHVVTNMSKAWRSWPLQDNCLFGCTHMKQQVLDHLMWPYKQPQSVTGLATRPSSMCLAQLVDLSSRIRSARFTAHKKHEIQRYSGTMLLLVIAILKKSELGRFVTRRQVCHRVFSLPASVFVCVCASITCLSAR